MKKINQQLTIGFLLMSLLWSCQDQLDLVDPSKISGESLTTSEVDIKLQLVGCYDALQTDYWFRRYSSAFDGFAGVGIFNLTSNRSWLDITKGTSNTESEVYSKVWANCYKSAVRANNLISNIDKIEEPETPILEMKSEAMVIRALSYYYLLALYKDVPYVDYVQALTKMDPPKESQETIQANIISDLEFAVQNLPVDHQQGRIGRAAALAIKARVHLYFNEMADVEAATAQIIGLNKYELFPEYAGLFDVKNQGNSEVIFSVSFESGINEGEKFSGSANKAPTKQNIFPLQSYADLFYCTDGLPAKLEGTWLETPLLGEVKSDIYNDKKFWENRDPRFDATIAHKKNSAPGGNFAPNSSPTNFGVQKYWRSNTLDFKNDGNLDYMVIRYAEVLLARAEALLKTQGLAAKDEIYALLNEVRERVNMPAIADSEEQVLGRSLTEDEIMMVIKHERFVELGAEGILWFDVKRWGDAEVIYNRITEIENESPVDYRPYRGERTEYWPIPQGELEINKKLEQHTWWVGAE
ncbi:MAG: RagB/SusD family nutrient uptake outer membrane protein [Carboxylicivirga sp.]|nr:RagB/SusD family nutrient uptake outer membrane protein [Carboxylicivirga sp.]